MSQIKLLKLMKNLKRKTYYFIFLTERKTYYISCNIWCPKQAIFSPYQRCPLIAYTTSSDR